MNPSIQHLQVLVHDGMRSDQVLSLRKRLIKVYHDYADELIKTYDKCLPRSGNKKVDDDCINPNSDGFEQ